MQLVINGQQKDFPELAGDAKISDLITQLGLKQDRVAIEQNGEIVPRTAWQSVSLRSGDKLEIVHFVGGGTSGGICVTEEAVLLTQASDQIACDSSVHVKRMCSEIASCQ
jgi:thiamine biosynthesis protein ThiS